MAKDAEEFLRHHGVLGMHWGQHKAGTPAQIARAARQARRAEPHPDHVQRVELTRNKTHTLSTAELKKINDRLQTEQQYKKLNPSTLSRGKKVTLGVIAGIGTGITLYNNINSPGGKKAIAAGKKAYIGIAAKLAETAVKSAA